MKQVLFALIFMLQQKRQGLQRGNFKNMQLIYPASYLANTIGSGLCGALLNYSFIISIQVFCTSD